MSTRHYQDLRTTTLDVSKLLAALDVGTEPGYDTFRFTYLKREMLRKYVDPSSMDLNALNQVAFRNAHNLEQMNRKVNEDGFSPLPGLKSLLFRARHVVADLLGPFSYEAYNLSRFSGGASTSRPKTKGSPYFKFSNKARSPLDVTPEAYSRAVSVFNATNVWSGASPVVLKQRPCAFRVITSNEVTTVPKDNETTRVIAKEPDGNMMLQLALGATIRERLALHGLDLDRSWRINQRLAQLGSANGKFATVDLQNASASINQRIVWELLPPDWFVELNAVRSKAGTWPDGETRQWHQFSSMGNGFTFELETVIFLSLAIAVMESVNIKAKIGHNIVVFGDDIVIPTEAVDLLTNVFSAVGFTLNRKKTYIRGPFRESCGGYYFSGRCVKPFRIKEPVDTVPRVVWLLNTIRKWSSHRMSGYKDFLPVCDPRLHEMYKGIYRRYRKHFSGSYVVPNVRGKTRVHQYDIRFGRDLNSSMAVVMPGGIPKHRISFESHKSKRSNHAAYCCSMQSHHFMEYYEPLDPRSDQWSVPRPTHFIEPDYKALSVRSSGVYLITTVTHSGRYCLNSVATWSPVGPVFPQEMQVN